MNYEFENKVESLMSNHIREKHSHAEYLVVDMGTYNEIKAKSMTYGRDNTGDPTQPERFLGLKICVIQIWEPQESVLEVA